MKSLDAHIFSLVEDPNMTFRELLDIVNSICLQRIPLTEKIDGQNFTLGFKDNKFCLMQKGNTDFNRSKYYHTAHRHGSGYGKDKRFVNIAFLY